MAARQTQSTKRQVPQRSVMLTRFKLSQQKRQLREKERKISESKSPIQKSTEDKKLKSKGTPSKNKKEKEEFHPSKLKRKIASKKIVLKSRHELKVIGGGGSCKRKLNLPQKGLKSPPAKRTKSCNDFNSDPSEPDRSQSPIYSELGFEEVIRMVDENQSLDDDDLLEILTCPSPVWWEDPPDEEYTEGPISITENSSKTISLPTLAKQFRSKTCRKKTPHKLILEPTESANNNNHADKPDTDNILDDATFKNINKTDDKFRNKRSKLESLLSIIKNKLDDSKCPNKNISTNDQDSKEKSKEEDNNDFSEFKSTHNRTIPNRSKKESETELDDITFTNISQQDKDSLKHLENIEIPIEGKSKNLVNKTEIKPPVVFRKKSMNPNDMLKVIKKSKNISYVTNKKLKILNIKKIANPLIQKKHLHMKFFSAKSILKEQMNSAEKPQTDKQFNVIERNNFHSEINTSICNDKEDKDIKSKNDSQNTNVSEKISDTNIAPKEDFKSEDFVTIFKIVSNTNDRKDIETKPPLDEIKEEIKPENEITDKETKTLDSYYRKCKGRKRDLTKTSFKEHKAIKDVKKEEFIDEEEELCDNCDKNTKKSIIVPSTTDVKYCLKCSSIFDLDECDYCIRKENEKQKFLKELEESYSDESAHDLCHLPNQNYPQRHRNENRNNFEDTSCV